MAVQTTSHGATIVTGNDIINLRHAMLLRAMEFEIKTGMKMTRVNPFKIVREEFGITARKKELVAARFRDILLSSGAVS